MSAFAGYVSFGPSGVAPGTEERLIRSLDGARLRRPQVHRGDGCVFVFRQRLVSPEDAFEQQPSCGRGIVSLFDGRLDNRGEILDALGLTSPAERPIPDGDLVRLAYERWEEGAVPRLLGDFAWAVWNGRACRLMLARDHSWHRSLYYARTGDALAFATGYRPLLALPDIPREMDEVAVAGLLLMAPEEGERSYYKAVSWVGSAMRVVATADGVRRDRIWEPGPRPILRISDGDAVEAARSLFDEAVRCRLRVAGPVVSSVSGGLDSSAVTATAARLRVPDAVHALCIAPVDGTPPITRPGWYPFERPYVDALAGMYPNLKLEYLVSIEPEEFERDPSAHFLTMGAPYWSPGGTGWFLRLYRRAAELGASTILQGDLGNMTFSAKGLNRLSSLRNRGAWLTFAWELLAARPSLPDGQWSGLVRGQLSSMAPSWLRTTVRRLRGGSEPAWQRDYVINPDYFRSAGLEEHHARFSFGLNDGSVAGARTRDLRTAVLRTRMAMEAEAANRNHSGVTISDPFSDRRIIEFCLSLPDDQFLRGGQTRSLARRVFADRVPPSITNNPRQGTQNGDWHQRLTPLRDKFMAEVDALERSPLASRMLDVPRIRRIMETWPADPEEALRTQWFTKHRMFRALHAGRFIRWLEGGNQ